MEELPNPILLQNILNHQQQDRDLMQLAQSSPTKFPVKKVGNVPLITHVKETS